MSFNEIDLRPGTRDFSVSTVRDKRYLGPDVIVTARDEDHALKLVRERGYETNETNFRPKEIKKRYR